MSDATPAAGFGPADLTTFARLDELGLEVTGQRLEPDQAVLACRVVEPEDSDERAKLSRRALRWALEGIVVAHLGMAQVAQGLGVSWNTANDAVLAGSTGRGWSGSMSTCGRWWS